jgi:hypothetical protein
MRGLSSKGFFGFNKTLSFYEELLTPGDALYARGPSRREQGKPNSEGSGPAPLGQLVMYASWRWARTPASPDQGSGVFRECPHLS